MGCRYIDATLAARTSVVMAVDPSITIPQSELSGGSTIRSFNHNELGPASYPMPMPPTASAVAIPTVAPPPTCIFSKIQSSET